MKRQYNKITIISVSAIIFFIILIVIVNILDIKIMLLQTWGKSSYRSSIAWNNSSYKKQIGNTCAAHSLMAVIEKQTGKSEDPYHINNQITEKYGDNYVYPWGITRYLKKLKIEANTIYMGLISEKGSKEYIKQKIQNGKPVILIIGNSRYLHYVSLWGYEEDTFSMYDSLVESDQNGNLPGNIDISWKELSNKWHSARFHGIKLQMLIVE